MSTDYVNLATQLISQATMTKALSYRVRNNSLVEMYSALISALNPYDRRTTIQKGSGII